MTTETLTEDTVLAYLAKHPGATAKEAGTTPVEMARREAKGKVIRVGARMTGGKGRRPVEWALPGAKIAPQENRIGDTALATYGDRADKLEKLGEALGGEKQRILNYAGARFRKPMTPADAAFLFDTVKHHIRSAGYKVDMDTLEVL